MAQILDCTEMVNSVSSLEDVDLVLEYLEKRFEHFQSKLVPSQSVLIFDNINGLCASLDSDSPGSMVEQVKSERVTRWLLQKV